MKIVFNFGTQRNVDTKLLNGVIAHLIELYTTGDFSNLHAGVGTLFINFYDENGTIQEIANEKGECVEYIIRGEPYKRKSKDLFEAFRYGHKDVESGDFVPDAIIYKKYT